MSQHEQNHYTRKPYSKWKKQDTKGHVQYNIFPFIWNVQNKQMLQQERI